MDDAESIGRRLRALREKHGVSQRKLAVRTGVANATISQIEAGALNPTVGVLKKILAGVSMSLGEFFADPDHSENEKIFFRATDLIELSEGGVSYRQVGGDLIGKLIQLMHERYEPGASTGRHALRHEGEEVGIVLQGQLTVSVSGRTGILGPGDAYYFRSDQPHSFKNEGGVMCELITACSPPSF
jgi:transcriptional regulator with XRE-family HTH domain